MTCFFCKIARGDMPTKMAYQDENICAFHDINPQAPIHILMIPKKHIATLNELQAGDEALVGQLFMAAKNLAAELGFADTGYRAVFNCNAHGGQSVYHIHLHLLAGRQMIWPPG